MAYKLTPQSIIGKGDESVYLYYYDNDRKLAAWENKDRWECKIGKSSEKSINRVLTQTSTSHARRPVLAVEARTESSYALESMIHNELKSFKIDGECGSEWFLTNPTEFVEIVKNKSASLEKVADAVGVENYSVTFAIDDFEDWGMAIASMRKTHSLSQQDVARISNVRQQTVSAAQNSKPNTRLMTVWKIIKSMGYQAVLIKPKK